MLALEIVSPSATLESLNLRTEKCGPDKVPAADMKISFPTSADVLAHFHPDLKNSMFTTGPKDLLGDTGLAVRDNHMQFPIGRDEEMTGATVKIGYGVGEPMVFQEAKVNSFRLTPQDGGSVVVAFRVQCRPSPEQVAKLYTLQETGVELTLEPCELKTLGGEE